MWPFSKKGKGKKKKKKATRNTNNAWENMRKKRQMLKDLLEEK